MESSNDKEFTLVTAGEYSDKRVEGLFSTPEKADDFKKKFPNEDWNDNTPIVLDRESVVPVDNHKVYFVRMFKNGDTDSITVQDMTLYSTERAYKKEFYFQDRVWGGEDGRKRIDVPEKVIQIYVWGKDEKHAVKIVNEIRAQLIALNLWGKISSYGKDTFEEIIAKAKEGFNLLE